MRDVTLYEICLGRQREALALAEEFDKAILNGASREQKEVLANSTKKKLLIALKDIDMVYHPNHIEILNKKLLKSKLEKVNIFLNA